MGNTRKHPDDIKNLRSISISKNQEIAIFDITGEKSLTFAIRKMAKYFLKNKIKAE